MALITEAVRKLETQSFSATMIFRFLQGKIELTDDEFHDLMIQFQDMEMNRAFGKCLRKLTCSEYRTCRKLDCKLGPIDPYQV